MNAPIKKLFAAPKGNTPEIRWVDIQTLKIDHVYQRMINAKRSQKLIGSIAEEWDWRLLPPLIISDRDGSYGEPGLFVIDGQHRQEAAILRGDIPQLPCMISRFESFEAEAMAFVNINTNRKQVTALDRFHARIAAGEELAIRIKTMVEAAGLKITRSNDAENWLPDEISFPDDVARALTRHREAHIKTALGLLSAWTNKPLLQGRDIFSGLIHIAEAQWPVDRDGFQTDFLNHLSSKWQSIWIHERNKILVSDDKRSNSEAMAEAFLKDFKGEKPSLKWKPIAHQSHKIVSISQDRLKSEAPIPPGKKTPKKTNLGDAPPEKGTIHKNLVKSPNQEQYVLKSGQSILGLGSEVKVGKWKGMPVSVLSLEERSTCPDYCAVIKHCIGNDMTWIPRMDNGPALERKIEENLRDLQESHPGGFVVNLHGLGDFYSEEYVDFWEKMLGKFSALRVFGFTAYDPSGPIGSKLLTMSVTHWEKFAIRFMNSGMSELSGIYAKQNHKIPEGAFLCRKNNGKVNDCASCAACWELEENVVFMIKESRNGKS